MLNHRLRIVISLLIAFFVVNLYGRISSGKLSTQIRFPRFDIAKLFTLRFNPQSNNIAKEQYNNNNSFNLPTAPLKPTNSDYFQPSLTPSNGPYPTASVVPELSITPKPTTFITKIPTYTPKPTKPPKPTKTPTPKPITTDTRPGNSLLEIYKEVNKRACYPTALLMAFKTMETGERFKNDSAATIKIYNTYGWWITGAGDPCYGYGYSHQTGIVPPDSVSAGKSCNSAIGDPTDIKIMGVISVSEWLQEVAQKYIVSIIPKNDRRVIFDNALMIAFISKSQLGTPPTDCNSWPDQAVRTAAEKLMGGVCQYYYSNGVSGDYCKQILDLYKQFKKEGL